MNRLIKMTETIVTDEAESLDYSTLIDNRNYIYNQDMFYMVNKKISLNSHLQEMEH